MLQGTNQPNASMVRHSFYHKTGEQTMKKSDREEIKKLEKLIKTQSKKIKALKHFDEKLTEIKFVNVFFDLKRYKKGEEDINHALNNGYEISRHFQTESGIVICLGKYKSKNKKASEARLNE